MTKTKVEITQETPDPIALRASIGGRPDIGYYLVYRGPKADVIAMIEATLEALREPRPTPE